MEAAPAGGVLRLSPAIVQSPLMNDQNWVFASYVRWVAPITSKGPPAGGSSASEASKVPIGTTLGVTSVQLPFEYSQVKFEGSPYLPTPPNMRTSPALESYTSDSPTFAGGPILKVRLIQPPPPRIHVPL